MINVSKLTDPRMWSRWRDAGALRGYSPPPCNADIFKNGDSIAALDARSSPAERWVRMVAKAAHARLDWHYYGGVAHVLHLGDDASRLRVVAAMRELENELDGHLMRIYEIGDPGLYRKGVTPVPDGAITSWMDSDTGQAVFATT